MSSVSIDIIASIKCLLSPLLHHLFCIFVYLHSEAHNGLIIE